MDGFETLALAGVQVRVQIMSGSPAIVFVHGFGGGLHSWDSIWDILPVGAGYVRYDLRGFGASKANSDERFQHPNDLINLLDRLGIEKCHLVGLSMGGGIAVSVALNHPERVNSVALLSPGLSGWEWSEGWRHIWRPISEAARSGDMDKAKALWLAHPMFAPVKAGPSKEALIQEVSRFSGDQWIKDRQEAGASDVERLNQLDLPILLLTGARDFEDFRLIADFMQATAQNVLRYDGPELGHLVHLEAPEWTVAKLIEFWADNEHVSGRVG